MWSSDPVHRLSAATAHRSARRKNCLDNDKIVAVVTRCHPIEKKELLIAVSLIFTQIFLRLCEKEQLLFPIEGKREEKKQRHPVWTCAGLEMTQKKENKCGAINICTVIHDKRIYDKNARIIRVIRHIIKCVHKRIPFKLTKI